MSPRGRPDARPRARFQTEERLLRRPEFRRATAHGSRRTSAHFVVYLAPNNLGRPRLGITTSRKVGKAVVRNRVKRLVREYFRMSKHRLPPARDLLVIARKADAAMKLEEVMRELDRVIGVDR